MPCRCPLRCAGRVLSAGYGSPSRTVRPEIRLWRRHAGTGRLPHLPVPKADEIVVAGLESALPATSRRMSTRRSGSVTPSPATAITSTSSGPHRRKPVIQNGMKGEVERCLSALEAALDGQNVCMVCSGDPGILAMAGLLYELRAREPRFGDIPIRVLPGITAATIAAASLGAPLQNGFSLVSLSDLLVPADEVRRNIRSVAQSLLPVALYNPAGRKRRALLDETLAVFREHRGRDVLCAYVKNAGREQETKWVGKLSEFPAAEVDMSTLIIIGGPRTRLDSGVLYEPRGYVEKYME
ncbi:MAG: precorrin-3B C(17)-methyltransferase [Bilophila wadsworthia]